MFEFTEEHRLKGMCRICASSKNKLISIFGPIGKRKEAFGLIHSYLPILVTPEDLLPVAICATCLTVLMKVQRLVENAILADKKMRDMLKVLVSNISQENPRDCLLINFTLILNSLLSHQYSQNIQANNIEHQISPSGSKFDSSVSSSKAEFFKSCEDNIIYRCFYCNQASSDANALLLHQTKSHPGNLLQCSECEFICTLDQDRKCSEHFELHARSTLEAECAENSSGSLMDYAPDDLGCQSESDLIRKEQKEPNIEGVHRIDTSINILQSTVVENSNLDIEDESDKYQKEVNWRCGFCGMKSKSRSKLAEHCSQRHKERMGDSISQIEVMDCFRCKKSFTSEVWMKDHLCHSILAAPQHNTSNKSMSCLSCPDIFRDLREFKKHLMSHTNSVRCTVCGAHFRSNDHLKAHMEKHEKKPSYGCAHCPRIFRLKSRLNIHLRTHTGERPYMCVKCGKRFSTDSGFRLHMSAHEGKKPYVCALCGQTFNRPSNLRRHEDMCRGGKKLICSICRESFPKREDLLCHRLMHSKEEKEAAQASQDCVNMVSKDSRFSCKVCNIKFDRVVDLFQHRKESHTMKELEEAKKAGRYDGGAFVCKDCGKELYNKRNFERHSLTHAGETRFACLVCSNKYSTKFALEYHMFTHTGERPHRCDLCSQGFKTKLSLRVHRMKHTGEKPYKCRQCSLGFLTAQSLRLHLVSHSDLRMFSCEYCSATFKRKKTLVTHVRIHTGEKPFACRYCGRQFTQKGTCSQHEKSHADSRFPHQKQVASMPSTEPGMHVTIIKDWKNKVSDPHEQDATLEVLVSQGDSVVDDGVQHMVLIEQDCTVDEQEILAVNEEMVLGATHTIVIEQDGMLSGIPLSGLKDENSDPQMPVPDE